MFRSSSESNFFFYKNYKDMSNLRKISNNFITQEGKLNVDYYDCKNNSLIIGEQSKQQLDGLVVTFGMSFYDVIKKISNNPDVRFKKLKYQVDVVNVETINGYKSCHIIY